MIYMVTKIVTTSKTDYDFQMDFWGQNQFLTLWLIDFEVKISSWRCD